MIETIKPLLDEGDTLIDGGNADFHLTRRRSAALAEQDIHFVGMGVSGGEQGARHGPSMMVGGTEHSWQQLKPILRAIAAQHEGEPCVAHLGPRLEIRIVRVHPGRGNDGRARDSRAHRDDRDPPWGDRGVDHLAVGGHIQQRAQRQPSVHCAHRLHVP